VSFIWRLNYEWARVCFEKIKLSSFRNSSCIGILCIRLLINDFSPSMIRVTSCHLKLENRGILSILNLRLLNRFNSLKCLLNLGSLNAFKDWLVLQSYFISIRWILGLLLLKGELLLWLSLESSIIVVIKHLSVKYWGLWGLRFESHMVSGVFRIISHMSEMSLNCPHIFRIKFPFNWFRS